MNIDDLFPSKYLKASDLKGRAVKVRIAGSKVVDIAGKGREEDEKLVLSFEGRKKEMVVNKTNALTIAEWLGGETDKWAGNEIELYPDKTRFQGGIVDCIRVREPAPAAEDDPQEDISF